MYSGAWGVMPPASENFVFFETPKQKKSAFSWIYSYSTYMNEDITPPCYRNCDIIGLTPSPVLESNNKRNF
jgi:hypothetical protein